MIQSILFTITYLFILFLVMFTYKLSRKNQEMVRCVESIKNETLSIQKDMNLIKEQQNIDETQDGKDGILCEDQLQNNAIVTKIREYGQCGKFEIEIYTTKLMPYAHLVPKSDFLRCKLTSKDHCIYSWNPLEDKENILKFHF